MNFDKFDFIENFLPDSPFVYIIFLFFFFFFTTIFVLTVAKLTKNKSIQNNNKKLTIEDLIKISKNEKSNIKDLVFAIEYFNSEFKVKQFPDKAVKFLKSVLTHKNRGKILFDIFHSKTVKLNKEFKERLNNLEKECLNK
ncbi:MULTISPECIES: hypothetical protein [unclassified Lebetimonas]|uniref:hypothetical protein n=1 Tax=unclassified Lebetimonas TaxID=2648158 RepID=UPI000463D145|nr:MULTISPECIES: hypothetical protein [unclassified Lebetimonas]